MMGPGNPPQELEWTPERIQRFWDFMSATSDDYFSDRYGAAIVQMLMPHLRDRQAVLDYGCGAGFLTGYLLERGLSTTAADSSPESLHVVQKKFDGQPGFGGAFAVDDLLARDERFDAVFCVEVVEHLDDEHLASLLRNLGALCRPDGVVIITTPNEERLQDSQAFCPSCNCVFHRKQHVRSWSASSLRQCLEAGHFDVIETLTTDFAVPSEKRRFRRWKRAWRYRRNPGRKRPHLVAVSRPSRQSPVPGNR